MAAKRGRKAATSEERPTRRPALTPEARENQMVALAVDLAEQQLREGTASSQVITHYLKLASRRERLEREILEKQRDLYEAKTSAIKSSQKIEELYADAIEAMKRYNVRGSEEVSEDEMP